VNRILIAEDEGKIASFLEKGLSSNGFVTTTVADGESAYQFARSGQFDLLILDLGLPLRDGLSVLKALRSEAIGIPVVILTARDSTADTVSGLESGADDYVRKPFAFDELLARVRLRLGGHGAGGWWFFARPADAARDGGRSCGRLDGAGVRLGRGARPSP
jgi:DNA-binding response OmpR family regulator